jgi:DNA-binding protein WhiA
VASRRGQTVLYLKGRESIAALLGRIGAVETLLAFEDAVASRRMREGINRTVNCELSNVRRVSRAAADQLAAIAYLRENRLLDGLSARLREVVRLRCTYPADDLTSLAGRSGGSIGRSGVFHRLRELVELARASGLGRDGRPALRGRRASKRPSSSS